MSGRQYIIGLLVTACVIVPILIGASCPPPQAPGFFSLITDNTNLTVLPSCTPGFVCISFANTATVPASVVLYQDAGFDPRNNCSGVFSVACCANTTSRTPCVCPCPGADQGDCQLNRDNLFTGCGNEPTNQYVSDINGQQILTLAPTQTALKRVRCGDIKTTGAAVARTDGDPIAEPLDQAGPIYRDEPGGVACGGTLQYLVYDLNETTAGGGADDLVTLALRTQTSR
ncbi:MAG: hypothetical protein AMXMBFR13_05900 [Phycisphaerae bacterium]